MGVGARDVLTRPWVMKEFRRKRTMWGALWGLEHIPGVISIRTVPLVLIAQFVFTVHAYALSDTRAVDFVRALFEQRDRLESFAHPADLARSKRLGISYEGVDHKFLISYDATPEARARVDVNLVQHRIEDLDSARRFGRLTLTIPGLADSLTYFFEDSLLISPLRYYTRGWRVVESEHFRFIVSDSASLRDYHRANLERFFEFAATKLGLSAEDREVLAGGKIDYYLCSGESEVRQLSGYTTLGVSNLAYDAVITSYHAHYHELVHLLMNLKLHSVPLFTHSLFQEGLAVALGGRGGKEPGPILELGHYLCASGMVGYQDLFSDSAFDALDPSMSYPVGGLYNSFLLEQLGWDRYLELYRRHSGTAEAVREQPLTERELPPDAAWRAFLDATGTRTAIRVDAEPDSGDRVFDSPTATVSAVGDRYCFSIRDSLLLLPDSTMRDFKSTQFEQMFRDRPYHGEKYAVVADPQEISVYNLYTGNLIAKCVGSFLTPPATFAPIDGRYRFSVARSVFEDDFRGDPTEPR